MDEVLILSMALCGVLGLLGFKFKSVPLLTISSLGWMIVAMQIHQSYQDPYLPMGLLMMLAFAQLLLGGRE